MVINGRLKMATEKQYYDRVQLIENAWQSIRTVDHAWSYLTDEGVDSENANHCEFGTPEYWDSMLMSLDCSVAMRLEDMGIPWSSFPIQLNY
jgi:hypothetical protein